MIVQKNILIVELVKINIGTVLTQKISIILCLIHCWSVRKDDLQYISEFKIQLSDGHLARIQHGAV